MKGRATKSEENHSRRSRPQPHSDITAYHRRYRLLGQVGHHLLSRLVLPLELLVREAVVIRPSAAGAVDAHGCRAQGNLLVHRRLVTSQLEPH